MRRREFITLAGGGGYRTSRRVDTETLFRGSLTVSNPAVPSRV
jgi:hypothetical protein